MVNTIHETKENNKVNSKTVQRSINIVQYVRWQKMFSFKSDAVLLFRAPHLIQALYKQDYQMHNNVAYQEIILCFLLISVTNDRLKAV